MTDTSAIVIAGHSTSRLNEIESLLSGTAGFKVRRSLISRDESSLQLSDSEQTDVVILCLSDGDDPLLKSLEISHSTDYALIVVGPPDNTTLMRRAFKAGATDFLTDPIDPEELSASVKNAQLESAINAGSSQGDVTVFVSPKGGAGATTLGVHLSHILSTRDHQPKVLLVDLDIQYGNLPLHFDEKPTRKLAQVLTNNERIDGSMLDACISRKHPKLHTLSTFSDQLLTPWDVNIDSLVSLIATTVKRYDHVLIDCPRSIDPVTFCALEKATRICVVVQQTISDIRTAHQYCRILQDQGVTTETFRIVVNRYEKNNMIRLPEFIEAFEGQEVHGVPNDYKRMAFTADNSIPLVQKWRNAAITKNLLGFAEECWPTQQPPKRWSFSYKKEINKAA